MGLDPDEKEFIENTFGAAFAWCLNFEIHYSVVIVDFMQYIKVKPSTAVTLGDLITHFKELAKRFMHMYQNRFTTVILMVDTKPMDVKRMVTHGKRYGNVERMEYVPGKPRLPRNFDEKVPEVWMEFAGNYQLLQRELYPLLFNAFMFDLVPVPGQTLILSGFPGRSWYETVYTNRPWECILDTNGQQWQVQQWKEEELPITPEMETADTDLYNRVYLMQHVVPCQEFPTGAILRREWEEAKCDLSEADVRLLYFEHWYQHEHICFCINDGDIFAISLLYAYERHTTITAEGRYLFRNQHTIMLPYRDTDKRKKKREKQNIYITPPPYQFVDVNLLYQLVNEYEPFRKGHVMNPVATFCFLLIMGGSDFFQDFLKGLGAQKTIWRVFFDNVGTFSHLVQLSQAVIKSTRTPREIVLDEDRFRQFCIYCYLEKYEPSILKEHKVQRVNLNDLIKRSRVTANGKKRMKRGSPDEEDVSYQMPDRNTMRLWCRQILWNLLYWKNAPFGIVPDPFEMWYGVPYYPYWRDETGKAVMISVVSSRPKPVDRVYSQHFIAKRQVKKREQIPEERKAEALKQLGHLMKQ
jgi:hypothetical protein